MTVKNKFRELQVGAVDDEEEDIAAVNDEANERVARVTVDIGAARSVWPRRKKGVLRRKLDQKPKLAAASGDEDRSVRRSSFGIHHSMPRKRASDCQFRRSHRRSVHISQLGQATEASTVNSPYTQESRTRIGLRIRVHHGNKATEALNGHALLAPESKIGIILRIQMRQHVENVGWTR